MSTKWIQINKEWKGKQNTNEPRHEAIWGNTKSKARASATRTLLWGKYITFQPCLAGARVRSSEHRSWALLYLMSKCHQQNPNYGIRSIAFYMEMFLVKFQVYFFDDYHVFIRQSVREGEEICKFLIFTTFYRNIFTLCILFYFCCKSSNTVRWWVTQTSIFSEKAW